MRYAVAVGLGKVARIGGILISEVIFMKKVFFALSISVLLSLGVFGQAAPIAPAAELKVGDMAPDFSLPDTGGKQVKLSDFRGKKNVVLAFYVLAFTGG